MNMRRISVFTAIALVLLARAAAVADGPRTGFQEWNAWREEIHLPADVVFVYSDEAARIKSWADHGFETWVMLGASWLDKQTDIVVQHPEIKQTISDGTPFEMIPGRAWVVPVQPWIDWFNRRVDKALEAGARGILPEEPEFFASTGYSESFKKAWREHYGEPWRAPHETLENNWRAGQLKAYLYEEFFRQVCGHVKSRDASVACLVPAHSNPNYTDWKIIAPHHAFFALEDTDGFIAQVWTGTAKHAHMLGGEPFASTFHYAFLEYSYFAELVRGTRKHAWFLTDPVEDAKGASWSDLEAWYEDTLAAALLHPSVNRYEIAPWPSRIFISTDLYGDGPVPESYKNQLFTIWKAQREMPEGGTWAGPVTTEIGFLTADSAMWQTGQGMSRFSGHIAPMLAAVRAGIPARVLPAERFAEPDYPPADIKLIVASFDAWKPVSPEIVQGMARWVKQGGVLLFLGGADEYDDMPSSWWRKQGMESPAAALLDALGLEMQRCKSWMPKVVPGLDTAAMLSTQTRVLDPVADAPPALSPSGPLQATLPLTACAVQDARVLFSNGGKPVVWDAPAGKGRIVYAGFAGEFVAAKAQGVDAFLNLLEYAAAQRQDISLQRAGAWQVERAPFRMGRCLSSGLKLTGRFQNLLEPGAPVVADPEFSAGQNFFLRQLDD
jgi:hypothetical protein